MFTATSYASQFLFTQTFKSAVALKKLYIKTKMAAVPGMRVEKVYLLLTLEFLKMYRKRRGSNAMQV